MASRFPLSPFLLEVRLEPRDDGGLRATCEKVPTLLLSHSDPDKVMADIQPALEVILSAMFGKKMLVERLVDFDDLHTAGHDVPDAHICAAQSRYVGRAAAN